MSNRLPDTPTVTLSATTLLFRGPFVPPPERVTSESERDRREDGFFDAEDVAVLLVWLCGEAVTRESVW
jgi:hypothetical protein